MHQILNFIFFVAGLILWVVALPIRLVAWAIATTRERLYDPEKDICPGCGFRGDRGTGGKTCIIRFVRVDGPEKASIEHTCLRCEAKFYSKIFWPAEKWLAPLDENKTVQIQRAARRAVI